MESPSWHNSLQEACQSYECYRPLAESPLHYYNHLVTIGGARGIIFQEFSVHLGHKWVILENNYKTETSMVRLSSGQTPMEIPSLIMPDFPDMINLKNKIRMILTFG